MVSSDAKLYCNVCRDGGETIFKGTNEEEEYVVSGEMKVGGYVDVKLDAC